MCPLVRKMLTIYSNQPIGIVFLSPASFSVTEKIGLSLRNPSFFENVENKKSSYLLSSLKLNGRTKIVRKS